MASAAKKSMVAFQAKNLSIAYSGVVALDIPDLDARGNIISVLGHNGAGKSTLIKAALDLLPKKSGSITISSIEDEKEMPLSPHRDMAFCPEMGAVFADISVEAYIKLWCRIKHHDAGFYRTGGSRYIERLKITPLLSKLGRELSKGQRRRVQTAIGFLTSPKFFLFDEPFDGLDVQKTRELTQIIIEESEHTSFFISSHRMDVIERLADTLIVLKEGKCVSSGPVDEVCAALCAQSIAIRNVHESEDLVPKLRTQFPSSLVTHIGNEVVVSGGGMNLDAIKAFVSQHTTNGVTVTETRPSLVEAMNYHLREVTESGID